MVAQGILVAKIMVVLAAVEPQQLVLTALQQLVVQEELVLHPL